MKICLACGEKFSDLSWICAACHFLPEIINGYYAFAPNLAKENKGFKANYFEELATVEEVNYWFRNRNYLILYALRRYFPNVNNFMEVGCGTGFVLSAIEKTYPSLSLFGSEIYSIGLSYAANRLKNAKLFQMDACQIPFENEFDVIGAFDVLEHIEDDELALSQMYQATREGGGIILTVPQHKFLWSKVDEHSCHMRRYDASELKNKVLNSGFEIENTMSFVSLLLPLMVLVRLKKRQSSGDCDTMPELKVDWWINIILEKILDIERGLIRLGINLPFGGSLILIARKV